MQKLKAPGYHADGGGLHLQVSPGGKSWIFSYRFAGRAREMGLGSLQRVSLAEARDERDKCNRLLRDHIDPIERRKQQRAAAIPKAHGTITFAEATDKYLIAHRAEWSPKHFKQWQQTLTQYAAPELGRLMVADIATAHVVRMLEPIWPTVNAERLRGRVEAVLSWAAVHGYRQQGDNPSGCLDHLLAKPSRSRTREHHAALPYAQMPEFMAKLRKQEGAPARALEFCILAAARTNEVRRATPAEIDHAAKVWTVPADRTKTRKEHRVPLCKRALELTGMSDGAYLFPGQTARSIDSMAMRRMLERLGYGQWSVHGLRSTFRDWAAERTNYPNHEVEMALAHAIGDKVEAAYRRGDLFDKRRALMDAWAQFCASPPAKSAGKVVVPLRAS